MLRMSTILGIIALNVMLARGGSDLPSSSAVSISISPSSAVIRVGQSVDLLGTASGFTRPRIDWWEHDASVNGYGEENCDDITLADSNLIASCPFGYLTGSSMVEASTETATYHAPMTRPGVLRRWH
jgi:hypothetical protein